MVHSEENLRRYYDARAKEYENMYKRKEPLWQRELGAIAKVIKEALSGRKVLEVACGTGYWTEITAKVAKYVVAIDASKEMLAIAQKRKPRSTNVEYRHGNAYDLASVPGKFDAGLANFWFSHIPKSRIDDFLHGFHKRLGKAAVVFMADNVYVAGIGGQLLTKPGIEDTFKLREASDGSKDEVLKNYYNYEELWLLLSPKTVNLEVHESNYFWWVKYLVP